MKSIATPLTLFLLLSASNLQAHEIWLEKHNNTQVKLFLGEPGEPESGDKIAGLKNTKIYVNQKEASFPITQHATHWSANVAHNGDILATVDDLWQPWDLEEVPTWQFWRSPKQQAAKLYAKAGRSNTQSKVEFEFVPIEPQSNTFTLTYKNAPVVEHDVTVLTPSKAQIKMTTNKDGQITVKTDQAGLYVVSSDYPVSGEAVIAGNKVDSTYNITSVTFQAN
ncbi:DUF4198 domain-containing protein [Pseudoalteromonas sp. KG3]|uniref:hypothetical protein n=1 Tax=Pseudoalteromonas TaxID=53246 RepID=UPI002657DC79|nr:hypothetical protein [Pseudoalteromonas sp. KG3]WKD25723.1 DUF4198 domain-containing protein [Pseudoalteromonas sp. KG3]